MSKEKCKIFIVDDDASVRRSFSMLLKSAGYVVETFSNAEEFLDLEDHSGEGCILLDIFMDGKTGLELQEEIKARFEFLPIIYITGQGDIPMSVRALKKGAINFLQKPVDDQVMLLAVEEALQASRQYIKEKGEQNRLKHLLDSLTPRESQVYLLLITGMLNKQIAAVLNIAEHTVKLHRGRITEKLGVKSVAEMVRIAEILKL